MNEKTVHTHKDLDVWKKSMDLAEQVYSLTARFPKEELYGLTVQIRRSEVRKMLLGLFRSLRKKPITHHPSLITSPL